MGYKLVTLGNLLGRKSIKTSKELLADILYHLNEVDPSKVIPLIAQAGGRLHRILQVDGPEVADQEPSHSILPRTFSKPNSSN